MLNMILTVIEIKYSGNHKNRFLIEILCRIIRSYKSQENNTLTDHYI
jgi:hypothetical protein